MQSGQRTSRTPGPVPTAGPVPRRIAANLKDVVYRAGVLQGGRKEWDLCWGRYLSSQVPSEKALLLQALGATRDLWQLQQ